MQASWFSRRTRTSPSSKHSLYGRSKGPVSNTRTRTKKSTSSFGTATTSRRSIATKEKSAWSARWSPCQTKNHHDLVLRHRRQARAPARPPNDTTDHPCPLAHRGHRFYQWIQYWNFGHVFRHTPNALMAVLLLWALAFNLLELFVYRRLGRCRRPKDPTDTLRHIVRSCFARWPPYLSPFLGRLCFGIPADTALEPRLSGRRGRTGLVNRPQPA